MRSSDAHCVGLGGSDEVEGWLGADTSSIRSFQVRTLLLGSYESYTVHSSTHTIVHRFLCFVLCRVYCSRSSPVHSTHFARHRNCNMCQNPSGKPCQKAQPSHFLPYLVTSMGAVTFPGWHVHCLVRLNFGSFRISGSSPAIFGNGLRSTD